MQPKRQNAQAVDTQRETKELLAEAMKQPGVMAVMKAYASYQAYVEMTLREPSNGGICITQGHADALVASHTEASNKLEKRMAATRLTLPYQRAYFRETFSDELWQAMEHRGLTQAKFARKAKVKRQFLTKVFGGGNCTMDTIVALAHALNYRAHVHLTPNDVACLKARSKIIEKKH